MRDELRPSQVGNDEEASGTYHSEECREKRCGAV